MRIKNLLSSGKTFIIQARVAGKFTLVVRYGIEAGVKLCISWLSVYAVIVGAVALRLIPIFTLLALLSLPHVFRAIKILIVNHNHPVQLAPSNSDSIKALSVASFGLIVG